MRRLTNEFLVGLLAILAAVAAVYAVMRVDDRPDGVRGVWTAYVVFPAAEGVYPDTPVRIAGVPVGSVDQVALDGGQARLTLVLQADVQLPDDSVAELKGEGVLGDKYVRLTPGSSPTNLADGGTLRAAKPGLDVDALAAQAALIAADVKDITGSLKEILGDDEARARVDSTLANIEALSAQLRSLTEGNRDDLVAITSNLREVSESLNRLVDTTNDAFTNELKSVESTTASIDRTIQHLESISKKVDDGEGTVGRLLNDSSTIDNVNATLSELNEAVGSVNEVVGGLKGMRTEVYYRGSYYLGTDPTKGGASFTENPVAGSARNVLGARLIPRPDYWYVFEFVSHPYGDFTYEDHVFPDLGTAYREYIVRPDSRYTFQIAKRLGDVVIRFGLKESSGGLGVDGLLFKDRLQVSADLYDFTYGSWPVMDGTPELQLTARAYPLRHVYIEGGLDNAILGARYGYVTGFAGGGFSFNDDDIKFVLAALPFSL